MDGETGWMRKRMGGNGESSAAVKTMTGAHSWWLGRTLRTFRFVFACLTTRVSSVFRFYERFRHSVGYGYQRSSTVYPNLLDDLLCAAAIA